MPGLDPRPLTRLEINQVLQGITDTPMTPPGIKTAAYWSTVAGLSKFCSTTDIDAVLDGHTATDVRVRR